MIRLLMIRLFEIAAFVSAFMLFYIYIGYFIILFIFRCLLPEKKIKKKEIYPDISLLISCYNEEAIIREKLENSLALDYPKDKIEVIVISDSSTDRTDEIVRQFEKKGVRLLRQEERKGKTAGLNLAVSQATGEIIVFSDANAMYEPDAIHKLVRNFNDAKVGYAVGASKYKDADKSGASKSERIYWQYEIWVKKLESRLKHVVGADGAMYAIRRELYEKLTYTDINDFVNPLQIILKGFRGVYEPEAICWEETAGSFHDEFNRKVRIINRSFSGLLRIKSVLNPFKTGIFSLEILTHKLLRWLSPLFAIIFVASCLALSLYNIAVFQWCALFLTAFLCCSYVGYLFRDCSKVWPVFYYPYYVVLMNTASLAGVYRSLKGSVQITWETFRSRNDEGGAEEMSRFSTGSLLHVVIHILALVSFCFFFNIVGKFTGVHLLTDKVIYWATLGIIAYAYFGYPLVLQVLSKYFKKPVCRSEITPEVTLLVCAYNEEEVIEEKIKNSFKLDYPPERLRIVVASDGSSDKTNDIVRRYQNGQLVLIDYPVRRGKVAVINDTVPRLKSEIILFSDANTMYQKDAVRKLVRNFSDTSVGGVSGNVILKNEETTFGRSESLYYAYERWIQKKESDFASIIGADGGMYAIRRELFTTLSPSTILDDFLISMNILLKGYRLVYDEKATAEEKNGIPSKAEFLRKSRIIAGAVQSLKRKEGVPSADKRGLFFCYVSHKFLRWIVPFLLIALFVVNCRLAFLSGNPLYIVTMAMQVLFYTLTLIGILFEERTRDFRLISVPFYFCLVNGAALYGIYKGLHNKQAVKWQKFSRLGGKAIQ
jgi:cellulose synthase/poly-beta-1,6-N-acetylglucosamine synthase-like glycosyltransferase